MLKAVALGLITIGFVATTGDARSAVVEAELRIAVGEVNFTGKTVKALTVNGRIPGPTLEFTEGDVARIHVRNDLDVPSSVHWHGLLVPPDQDGVPAISFPGIAPHSDFTYEFPIRQAGTYWYHSHSGLQEQRGVYGSIVIHPRDGERHPADREQVMVLSDWTDENPERVAGLLRSGNEWYAIERNTNQSLWGALRRNRLGDFLRREWESMPDNEIADVAYDRFLINGETTPEIHAEPGETVRLRIINAASASYFYVQFAGGPMTVVAADGMEVEPFELDRLLIAVAETYDVLITVPGEGSSGFRATAQDGSGHVEAVIGKGDLLTAPEVPDPDYYRNAMNAGYIRAMWRTAWDVGGDVALLPPGEPTPETASPEKKSSGMGAMAAMAAMGQDSGAEDGAKTSRPGTPYSKLRSPNDTTIEGPRPTRVVKLNLTGDMDRYVWSMNGNILLPSNTIRIKKGERVRFEMSNRTMMSHPMHLHGHFFRVLNGQGTHAPLKHTVDVPPMQTTVVEFEANEEKDWFFHCHILYHMKSGMERIVHYEGTEVDAATLAVRPRLYDDSWYTFGSASILSQMAQGSAEIANTRNIFGLGWEVGYDDGDYDVTGSYSYYINRYLSPFLGVNAYSEADSGKDVRGVFGLSWLLPLNIHTSVWVGTDKSFRWSAEKEVAITRRLVGFADTQYDTVTGWEWASGAEFIVTRYISLYGQYSSEFGAGGGLRIRLSSPSF
jgi:FtsP/CotA-like multicopper oxidase with cupredoxin domain